MVDQSISILDLTGGEVDGDNELALADAIPVIDSWLRYRYGELVANSWDRKEVNPVARKGWCSQRGQLGFPGKANRVGGLGVVKEAL